MPATKQAAAAGGSTREAIVAAADMLFYQRGVASTSFADIAAQVHISRGNFYHHFKTKDEILDAVIALRTTRTGAMLAAWADEAPDAGARLRRFAWNCRRRRRPACLNLAMRELCLVVARVL